MALIFLMLFILLLLLIVLTIKFVLTWIKFKDIDRLPGPPTIPFLGNLLDLGSDMIESHRNFCEFPRKYGELIRVWFGPFMPTLMVGKPEHIEYFLSSTVHITKSPGYDFLKLFLGNGLITSGGDYWKRHRKIITPTFHFKILEQFLTFTTGNVNTLIDKMKEHIDKENDIFPLVKMFALDNILQTAMNYKLNAMNDEGGEYVDAVKVFMEIFMKRFFSVVLRIDAIFRFTSYYGERNEALKILKNFTENIIKTRREDRKKYQQSEVKVRNDAENNEIGIKTKKAFLDLMLDIAETNNLTDQEIKEEVDTFVLAGHDTISSSLSFALFELANRPEIQDKIYEESVQVIGHDIKTPMLYKFMQDLKYLEMVIKEVLRLHTIVPLLQRILDVDVEFDGYKFPAGTQVLITAFATHHNPEYYPNPEKFDPDRFLPEICSKRHPYAFIPFSAGPRNCIGQKFALMELKLALVNIIRNFHIHPVMPEHKLLLGSRGILKSFNGIPIKLSLREPIKGATFY